MPDASVSQSEASAAYLTVTLSGEQWDLIVAAAIEGNHNPSRRGFRKNQTAINALADALNSAARELED